MCMFLLAQLCCVVGVGLAATIPWPIFDPIVKDNPRENKYLLFLVATTLNNFLELGLG